MPPDISGAEGLLPDTAVTGGSGFLFSVRLHLQAFPPIRCHKIAGQPIKIRSG